MLNKTGKKATFLSALLAIALLGSLPGLAFGANPPESEIDYLHELIIGLDSNAYYLITDGTANEYDSQASPAGTIAIDPTWFGKTLDIIETDADFAPLDGDGQVLVIPTRPAAPSGLVATDETYIGQGGSITGTTEDMEFTADQSTPAAEWNACSGTSISGLAPGTYYVRYSAETASPESFASQYVSLTLNAGIQADCRVDDVYYLDFADAWAAVADDQTIYLLKDIVYNAELAVTDRQFSIDLAGFDLTINDAALMVSGADAALTITGSGTLTATKVVADDQAVLSIAADIISTADSALIAKAGASVSISGDIVSAKHGIEASGQDTSVTMTGDVTSIAEDAAGIFAFDGAEVSLVGNIEAFYGIHVDASPTFDGTTTVTMTGDITWSVQGVYVRHTGSTVTVNGNILDTRLGVNADYGSVIIDGYIESRQYGVEARIEATVLITGSITCVGTEYGIKVGVLSSFDSSVTTGSITVDADHAYGISVYIKGNATVNGDITVRGQRALGITTYGMVTDTDFTSGDAFVQVSGSIKVTGEEAIGIEIAYNSRVIVDGDIEAPVFITFSDAYDLEHAPIEKTPSQYDASSQMEGYLQYSGGSPVSYVWIKIKPVDLEPDLPTPPTTNPTGPGTPATGDASTGLGALTAILLATLGASSLVLRRRQRLI